MILKFDNGDKVLVVSHDAGGAEVVCSWVRRNSNFQYTFILAGPAVGIYEKKLGPIPVLGSDDLTAEIVRNSKVLLTSTSWGSDIERKAISLATSEGVYAISFLDHWCHYVARFRHGNDLVLPDEIWVGDEDALDIAKECFPGTPLTLVDNPFFKDIKLEFAQAAENYTELSSRFQILYICEAAAESGQTLPNGNWIEYESMDLFLDQVAKISNGQDILVRIRAHPAESDDKYTQYLGQHDNIDVEMARGRTLIEDCQRSNWIVGMNSMALVVAVIGGKKVFYCNLNQVKPNNLPIRGMENLFDVPFLG